MCSYDVVGFQTDADRQSFVDYIERGRHGTASDDNMVHAYNRFLKVAAYPIGIYPDAIAKAAVQFTDRKPVKSLRDAMRGRKLIMSVDRLDYSKGLVERFQAFERVLLNPHARPHPRGGAVPAVAGRLLDPVPRGNESGRKGVRRFAGSRRSRRIGVV